MSRPVSPVPHLLLVCPRPEVLGKLLGLPVAITVVHRPDGDRELEESLALEVIDADFTDPVALLGAARACHTRRPIDAMLGLTELSLYPVSVVADELGVRANPPGAVGYAQNKASMRRRLAECGVSATAHRVCTEQAEAAEFALGCSSGMILKPVSGNGGTGVFLVREPGELAAGWSWATTSSGAWAWRKENDTVPAVLAEEYLTGREFSVETLSAAGKHHVLAVTGKHTTGPPHFVEMGHDMPARVADAERSTIAAGALDALDAIGYAWGPCHTEVILDDSGAKATVVEINARQGGDQIWELVELVTGWDMITGSAATLAYGESPPHPGISVGGAAIRYLTSPQGTVTGVDGLPDALAVEGVLRVSELSRPGDVVSPLGDSWNRAGYVLAAGLDVAAAVAAADRAAAMLVVRTTEPATAGGG
jgi:biotin carboxylase